MNWKHVHLIFMREMSDQLRDRRTLFTITVLPLLLYPLIGMLMMQMAQFSGENTVRVRLVGIEHWPAELPLLDDAAQLSSRFGAGNRRLIEFETRAWPEDGRSVEELIEQARADVMSDAVDAILLIEPSFEAQLKERLISQSTHGNGTGEADARLVSPEAPSRQGSQGPAVSLDEPLPRSPSRAAETDDASREDGLRLIANLARDHSQMAQRRLETIIDQWRNAWVAEQLESAGMNPRLVQPLRVGETDASKSSVRRAMLWSKVLPFVMLVWALTGAFYPAIDLCAGEKERGTLETLLSSPARRREIVWGKLLTISVFSMGSAVLNLMSMHVTAGIIVKQLAAQGTGELAQVLGPMPLSALGWLLLLLLPMAAFFSALALAVAALARSTKEGQYYLMPLLLVTLPLVALPMLPSLEMNLGTSLIPVSGAVFLVRSLIEGRYTEALIHLPIVLLVTIGCCWLALRWAIRQFESESVMFRESERWNLRLWMHHLWRDREATATPGEAMLCGAIILVAMFFAQFVAGSTIDSWGAIVRSTVTVQIGLILTPCLLMALFLTRSLRQALRLHRTQPTHLVAAALMGVAMHPAYLALGQGITHLYEVGEETARVLEGFQGLIMAQPLWTILLLLALLPAVCEELTFRGFIFGGLLHQGGALRAIVVSALFFGFTHTLLQQSIAASMMGLVLGLIAWRTGGVVCTIIVHAINNTLSLTLAWCTANHRDLPSTLQWAITTEDGQWAYQPTWIALSIFLSLGLLIVLFRRNRDTQQVVQAEMI